jgi:uncharacterized phiE125 gp8 family phage protein
MASYTEITTQPTVEPLELDELKEYLRVGSGEIDDDNDLRALITVARKHVENYTNRAFMSQTRTLRMPCFPPLSDHFYLDGTPVQSITSITYYDTGGTQQTLASSKYQLIKGPPDRIELKYNESWPSTRSDRDLIEVIYVCGESSHDDVDPVIKHAMKIFCQIEWDELSEKKEASKNITLKSLMDSLRIGDDWHGVG